VTSRCVLLAYSASVNSLLSLSVFESSVSLSLPLARNSVGSLTLFFLDKNGKPVFSSSWRKFLSIIAPGCATIRSDSYLNC